MDVERVGMLVVGVGIAAAGGLAFVGTLLLLASRLGWRTLTRVERVVSWGGIAAALVVALCFLYGVHVEADWLSVSRHTIATSKLRPGQRLRIVHVTDLHVDQDSPVLQQLADVVNAEKPDLVIFTGDALNAASGAPIFRRVLGAMAALHGTYAVHGNHDVAFWDHVDLFGGGVATALHGTPRRVPNTPVVLCGTPYDKPDALKACLTQAGPGLRVAAYHTPDLVEDVAGLADVYLAGHTHGGQVRVPFYGAVVTLSAFGKRYEMGLYDVKGTALHVSRGIGFEPAPAPRVRFLCRPEVAVLDLVGS